MRTPAPPGGLAVLLALGASLAGLAGCGEPPPLPPLPADLEGFLPALTARIEEAAAAVRADPDDPARWGRLGEIYEANGLLEPALVCYERTEELGGAGHRARWAYRRALVHAALGDLARAMEEMERSIERDPDYAAAHWRLGGWRLEQGDLDGAELAFAAARAADAGHPGGWTGAARVLLQRGRPDEALDALAQARRARPEDGYVLQLMATAHREAGRYEEAEAFLVRASSEGAAWRDPWQDELWQHREGLDLEKARHLTATGRAAEAIPIIEALRRPRPRDTGLMRNLSRAFVELGRFDDALSLLDEAAGLEPDNAGIRLNQAAVRERMGEPELALACAEQAARLQPGHAGAHRTRALLLYRLGEPGAALAAFERVVELDQRDPSARMWVGTLRLQLQRWAAAEATLVALVADEPTMVDAWVGLALARARQGKRAEAERALAAAERLGRGDPARFGAVRALLDSQGGGG